MENRKQRVILTGSSGRIGRAVVERYREKWDLLPLSRHAGNGRAALTTWLDSHPAGDVDILIHGAWSSVPATAEKNPDNLERYDIPLLHRILHKLKQMPNPPLLLFLSTGAVYGNAPGRPSLESDPPNPIGNYAQGKLQAEQALILSELPVCILRTGNVYALESGKNDPQGVLGHLIRAGLHGYPFEQWGADSVKDYLHREDFLDALGLVTEQRLEGVWNLGSGMGTSLSELIEYVESATEHPLTIVQKSHPSWDVSDNRLDVSKLQNALCWSSGIDLQKGILREVGRLATE